MENVKGDLYNMKRKINLFIKKENVNFKNITNPVYIFNLLYKYKYIHFFATGLSGVIINLTITWLLTEFYFGLDNYFYSYLFGLSANIIWNFIIHTQINFKIKTKYLKRFIIFVIYTLILSFIQANLVKLIVPIIGLKYYLLIIASVILFFSFLTFIIFKFWLFKNE